MSADAGTVIRSRYHARCRHQPTAANAPTMKRLRELTAEHPIESVGADVRKNMPWLKAIKK